MKLLDFIIGRYFETLVRCGVSPDKAKNLAKDLEDDIRCNYGGRRSYVNSVDLSDRNRKVVAFYNEHIRSGAGIVEARNASCRAFDISISTFYRVLNETEIQ